MVDRDDIHTLLQTGSWRSSRSRSPNPSGRLPQAGPSYETDAQFSRSAGRPRRIRRPPPPSVEDEAESLAREHTPSIAPSWSDDEPKHRGEVDQQPILVPVSEQGAEPASEHNSERRFVLVSSDLGVDDARDPPSPGPGRSPTKSEYVDNTCRQYVLVTSDESNKEQGEKKLGLGKKKKSHQDLPRLNTDFEHRESSIKRSSSRRNREKPVIEQPIPDSARESVRPPSDVFLSPIVTHTTGGRDRAYLDINSGPGKSPSAKGPREEPRPKRSEDRRSVHSSSSPSVRRRMSSTAGPRPSASALAAFGYGNADDIYAFMMPGGEAPPRGERTSESPTKTRRSISPPYPPSSRDRLADRPAGQRARRQSNAREQAEYYGSSSFKSSGSSRSERPRPRRDTDSLLSPDQARSGPKGPSPLPSPRIAQGPQFPDASPLPSPRSSTLPYPIDRRRTDEYSVASSATAGSPPRRQEDGDKASRPRAPSRSASIPSGGIPMPIPAPLGRVGTADRRAPTTVREETQDSGPQSQPWQPPPFDPEEHSVYLDKPVTTYRRYSEDVQHGVLPQLPECRWVVPTVPSSRTGSSQFLTLPTANNFTICSECYGGVFATIGEFNQVFVRAPPRPADQPILCDFGSSPWYRIAFLMTLKHRYRDLRLLEIVANVAARNQPCPGERPANRIWYSMLDPGARRPINTFSICPTCTEMIGALFPNLADIFFPLDPYPAPRKSICDLHFAPERKRFLEYFDLMETTSDRARNRRALPDVQELADRVRDLSLMEECPRNTAVQNMKWHVMDSLPEFTVCEECYDTVVWPLVEDEKKYSDVSANFIRARQTVPIASCQLYSPRMREVFRRACRRNDLGYLETKLREKLATESEIAARQAALQKQDQNDPEVQRERSELAKRWKENE